MEQKTKKFIYINIWCDIVSFVTISQVWRCEVMAIHHHSDLPGSWLQNTKPYQLPTKNSIFWSSDFRKIPFLPLFLYIFCTKITQITQITHILLYMKKFYKIYRVDWKKKQKIFIYNIYGAWFAWFAWFWTVQNFKNYHWCYASFASFASFQYIFCTKLTQMTQMTHFYDVTF